MPSMPKDQIHEGLPEPGWYLAEVTAATRKTSRAGDAMYNLELCTPGGDWLCYDNIMLEGKGNGIGFRRLFALGAARDQGDSVEYAEAHQLVGKRAYVYLKHGEWEGKKRAEVDVSQGRAGYLPPNEPPDEQPGAVDSREDADEFEPEADDIPF